SGLLLALVVGFVVALTMRASFQVDIMRDRNALYSWSEMNEIENIYQLKIMNKSQRSQQYLVSIAGLQGAKVRWASNQGEARSPGVAAGEIGDFTAIVTLPADAEYSRSQRIELIFSETEGEALETVREETRFWGPARNSE
ncbi:MAG: hypothetical protein KJP04_09305, partial [Arenicella sp.]|nr:hypothetical protein [Arenicella sp.]